MANFGILYISLDLKELEPFFAMYGIYLFTMFIVVFIQSLNKYENGDALTKLAQRIITNGKGMFFMTGLALFDLLLFILLVPENSVVYLEEQGYSLIIYSLMFLFIPLLLLKYTLEKHALSFEEIFWTNFKAKIKQSSNPSSNFATFILARINYRANQQQTRKNLNMEKELRSINTDEIITTAYPANNSEDSQSIIKDERNPLFDTEDQLVEDNPIEIYGKEIITLFPELEPYTKASPVNIRLELLLNIVIEKTSQDPEINQLFQKMKI